MYDENTHKLVVDAIIAAKNAFPGNEDAEDVVCYLAGYFAAAFDDPMFETVLQNAARYNEDQGD